MTFRALGCCLMWWMFGTAQAMQAQAPDPSAAAMALQLSARLGVPAAPEAAPASDELPLALRLDDGLDAEHIRDVVLDEGESMLGTDYVLGANRPDAVDCSSLVQRMFAAIGRKLPRTARELVREGQAVDVAELQPGDLLFYRWGRRELHVGVYLDEGRLLHASTGQREVVVTTLNDTWNRRLVAARRLL